MRACYCHHLGLRGPIIRVTSPSFQPIEQQIRLLQTRIADQKLGLDRMTVRGFPTQRATDLLNKTSADLQLLRQHPQILRGE
jgi:hypothetical protein